MSKFDIGVGEDFPLDEGQPERDRCGRHGRHRHHHGRHHHNHEDRHHGHAHLAALAMLFAWKAHRHRMRGHAEPHRGDR